MRSRSLNGLLVGLFIEGWLIHLMSGHGDFLPKGEAWKFTLLGAGAGAGYWVVARSFVRWHSAEKHRAAVFWLAAVLLRLVMLPTVPGDDLWRYRWEGMIQLHGINPYEFSPDSPALAYLRDADWLKINHRDYAAIYPPLTEATFAAMAALGNSVWSYKALFALADLACIAVLRRLLARSGAAREQAVWYAWNPLVIYAFAGAAHFDSLMILTLLGAIYALDRCGQDDTSTNGIPNSHGIQIPYWVSSFLLGLSIAVKIAPLAVLPVWAFAAGSWRRLWVLLPVTLAPLATSALAYGFPAVPVFTTLQRFGRSFRVNDPVWWLVETTAWLNLSSDNVLPGAFALVVCLALACWFRHDWRRGLLWVWGAALLLSPVVHAWYVVWVLPLAAWRGENARPWFVFSISTFGYFLLWEVNHASGQPWRQPLWLRLAILLPPLLAVGWTAFIRRHAAPGPGAEEPKPLNSPDSTTTI